MTETVKAPQEFKCKARPWLAVDPPQDCDWPGCGCDPYANKVLAALEEIGALKETEPASLTNSKDRRARRIGILCAAVDRYDALEKAAATADDRGLEMASGAIENDYVISDASIVVDQATGVLIAAAAKTIIDDELRNLGVILS